jgi:hypothetical protein
VRRWLAAVLLGAACVAGGQINLSGPARGKDHVASLAELQTVAAGKPATVEMLFRVDGGFHINSHTPKSELLIPTALMLQPAAGVKVGAIDYPAGTMYSFSFDPKEKLDVYTGEFRVVVHVTAKAGVSALSGMLRYQACDNAACYPPRMLPVQVSITAK